MADPIPSEDFSSSLVLIDGSALAYRAFYAIRSNLSSPKGEPTAAVFGFTADLRRLLSRLQPRFAAVVFDTPEPTFRHRLFQAYKATRERMPEELVEQLPRIHEVSRALGFAVITLPGYEADDVMGTLARQAEERGIPVFLVTGDKDFMQLVSDRVRLYNITKKGEEVVIIGPREVREKLGVPPEKVTDVLALVGDASDNIPGIPGVGPKGARRILDHYDSLEALLENPGEDLSPRIRQSLKEHAEQGRLSKRLATIETRAPVAERLEDLEYRGPHRQNAAALFIELGFRTFAEEMSARQPQERPAAGYSLVRTPAELTALIARLSAASLYAVDTETTGLDPRRARIVGLSFSCAAGKAWYVPLQGLEPALLPDPPGAHRGQAVLEQLRSLLEDPRPVKCGQNVKYDLLVLRNHGLRLQGVVTDTMIASYLLEPQQRERSLDAMALRYFGHVKIKTEELIGRGRDQITMDLVPVEQVAVYAAEDADFTLRLAQLFLPRLEQESLADLHRRVEVPLIEVLADMEEAGVRVDPDHLRRMAGELERQAAELEAAIHQAAGGEFKINSPKQLGEVLFERLKVHESCGFKPRRTQTGWATGQEVLEALADHPLPARILEYRSLTKLLNTYVRTLPDLVDPETGRIHASFNQAVAATGRLSSSDPNLQNIPVRTEAGRRIREAFLPADDHHRLVSADYSQVELRILAHLSEDPELVRAFREGHDIHRDTAARVFRVSPGEVDATMRARAKAINFGILYGMGPQRLSRETGLTLEEARLFIDRYFQAFPAVRDFLEGLKDFARREGYARTLLGRRRPIPEMASSNRVLRVAAENMAVNTPIQGSAADILKVAMVAIHRRLRQESFRSRMILTVHDELVFDAPQEECARLKVLVREEMEGALPLVVPLKVDLGEGRNWLEAH